MMKNYSKLWLIGIVLTLTVLVIMTMVVQLGYAAGPWYVGPGGSDGNACTGLATRCATINGALNKPGFVAGDTILVQTGTYTGSGNQVVLLDKDATLSGGWNSNFSTQNGMSTVDGEEVRRGIWVDGGVTATVERFTVQNSSTTSLGGILIAQTGTLTLNNSLIINNLQRGIYSHGVLTLNNSTVSQNTTDRDGGGIINFSSGVLILNNSVVSDNTAGDQWQGGGILNYGALTLNNSIIDNNTAGSLGGGISSKNTLTLNNSTVSNNTGSFGGGIHTDGHLTLNDSIVSHNITDRNGGGIFINDGTVTLNNSIVSGNTAFNSGAGTNGGGIYDSAGDTVTLNNSTVSSNTASSGGGIYRLNIGVMILNNSTISGNVANFGLGGGIFTWFGSLEVNNTTITGNTASSGGGIFKEVVGGVILQNTILAGNTASETGVDCSGTLGSPGYNLLGNTSGCSLIPPTGDLTDVDPKLGPLQDNGGPTETHALLAGSPAIDAGSCSGIGADQRGKPRPVDLLVNANTDDGCDIGAYEAQPLVYSAKTVNQSTTLPGDSVTYTITLDNGGPTNLTNVQMTDTLSASLIYINNSLTATSGSYSFNSGTISWNGDVNAGEGVTINFGATVSQTVSLGTSITNSAVINGGGEIITRAATVDVASPGPETSSVYLPIVLKN